MHEVRIAGQDILARQLERAERNYRRFHEHGVRAVSVMGAIGSGKTSLIERMIALLRAADRHVGTIAGDSAGDDDHRRFAAAGASSVNLNTQDDCHLDAHRIEHCLDGLPLAELDVLFVENVGNLICPADFPLGTDRELVVISVTEGDDMVRKHPKIFAQTDLVAINKVDLADAVGVDPKVIVSDYARLNPHGTAILTDARHDRGIDELLEALGMGCTSTPW
ncbi:MAG: hydrogenase nickel incorporation protein HypB [Candidatus Bipolaricaulota bacterium]|nr:MAG: hydrogenase nickel incorporation protein HypB [Candidatus Bipolaricaulota bacterium]